MLNRIAVRMVSGAKPFRYSKPFCTTSASGEKIPARNVPFAQHQNKDGTAEHQSQPNAGEHGFSGSFLITGTYILGYKGSHGLHKGAGDQHGKIDNFTGDTVSGRCRQPQSVDKGTQCQKGKLGQEFLRARGRPMPRNFRHWGFRRKSSRRMVKGIFFLMSRLMARTTLIAWAATVAMAAPAASM